MTVASMRHSGEGMKNANMIIRDEAVNAPELGARGLDDQSRRAWVLVVTMRVIRAGGVELPFPARRRALTVVPDPDDTVLPAQDVTDQLPPRPQRRRSGKHRCRGRGRLNA